MSHSVYYKLIKIQAFTELADAALHYTTTY